MFRVLTKFFLNTKIVERTKENWGATSVNTSRHPVKSMGKCFEWAAKEPQGPVKIKWRFTENVQSSMTCPNIGLFNYTKLPGVSNMVTMSLYMWQILMFQL